MVRRRLLGCLGVAVVAVAACGEIPEPEGFTIVTTTTTPVEDPADQAALQGATAVQSEAPATAEFVPLTLPDYVPEVVMATDGVVLSAENLASPAPLGGSFAGLSAIEAVDDLSGGLVVQQRSTPDQDGDVLWFRGEGGEPMVIDDRGGRLLDVGFVGGSPSVVILVGDRQIDRVRLVDNNRTEMLTLDESEELLDLAASGGFHAVVVTNERCGDLRFYGADGSLLGLDGPGEPDCIVPRRPGYGAVALSPDAGAIVYTEVSYRDDGIEVATELVARELPSGAEFFRRRIGEDGDRITALSFDGERVAYIRRSDTDVSVTVLDLNDETETPIALDGVEAVDSVSFARLPLAGS